MASQASRVTFFVIFAICGWLFFKTMRPLFLWLGLAAFCAILTYSTYLRLCHVLRGRRRLAAGISTFGVVAIIVTPLLLTGWAVVDQALDFAQYLQETPEMKKTDADGLPAVIPQVLRSPIERIRDAIPFTREQMRGWAASAAQAATKVLSGVLASATGVAIGIFLWILSLYYFYLEGERWLTEVLHLLPLPERHSIAFFREFRQVSHAVFFGTIVTSLAQGILGGAAFLIVGIPGAVLWGALIAVAGILPMVGAVLVWGPAAIWLFLQGRPVAAAFMLAWGALVVGTIDNILRPLLAKGQLEMHPLLVFLSIFGGLAAFGFVGILLGPLFAALFLAALRIYSHEFPKTPPEETEQIVEEGIEAPLH